MGEHILVLDAGTTSTRAMTFAPDGTVEAVAQKDLTQHYPKPGWVEHDAEEIWRATQQTTRAALVDAAAKGVNVKALGITNLRVLAASEGPADQPWRVQPALQTAPGVYDEALLEGLDVLLAEMAARDMTAVLVLNNFFQWSGGMAQYVSWATGTPIPYPNAGEHTWDAFQMYAAQFYANEDAMRMADDLIRHLVLRTNTVTGQAYREDPTIMAWQLGNEPRGLDDHLVDACTGTATVATVGDVESLNVAVAGSVALYELVRRQG